MSRRSRSRRWTSTPGPVSRRTGSAAMPLRHGPLTSPYRRGKYPRRVSGQRMAVGATRRRTGGCHGWCRRPAGRPGARAGCSRDSNGIGTTRNVQINAGAYQWGASRACCSAAGVAMGQACPVVGRRAGAVNQPPEILLLKCLLDAGSLRRRTKGAIDLLTGSSPINAGAQPSAARVAGWRTAAVTC